MLFTFIFVFIDMLVANYPLDINSYNKLPNLIKRSSYVRLDKDLIRLVNHLCTESILLIWPTAVGDHTGEQ